MVPVRRWLVNPILPLLISTSVSFAAAWQPPKDGAMTEQQMTTYLQIQKQVLDDWKAAGKAVDGTQSSAMAMAMVMQNDQKFKTTLASHNLSQDEYNWIGQQVWAAYGSNMADQIMQQGQKGIDDQMKSIQQRLTDDKTKLDQYQKAQANGRRVLSKDERQQAIDSAKADQQAALDEAKQHAEEAKAAQADLDKADADAKTADGLAQNPPSDVTADDRPGYIEQKKQEAQTARDAAKDVLQKLGELRMQMAEAQAKAAAAGKRIADPDLPMTDDAKADIKKQNDEQIAATNNEIKDLEQTQKTLSDANQTYTSTIAEQKKKMNVPQANLDLFNKHQAEFESIWGIKK